MNNEISIVVSNEDEYYTDNLNSDYNRLRELRGSINAMLKQYKSISKEVLRRNKRLEISLKSMSITHRDRIDIQHLIKQVSILNIEINKALSEIGPLEKDKGPLNERKYSI